MSLPADRDSRISREHFSRAAVVYVRQSTPGQVRSNVESTRVQRGLRERAIALGWPSPEVLDDDLGVSASGFADRPGFQRMLARVTLREIGLILCVDASRLSRNSKDWAHLFELCGYFNTLIADLDQVYDLSLPNDRLVLGIKGTVCELELSVLRNRLKLGAEAKAARGELKFIVPPGYAHDLDGRIVLDPDARVRQAIATMFDQLDRSSSVRQLALWYRDRQIPFPVRNSHKTRVTSWEIPSPSTIEKLIRHPIYTGAYVYGRRTTRVELVDGKLQKRVGNFVPPERCRVFLRDHHPAYISWDRYLANQAKIAESRPRWRMDDNLGAVREGRALLTGLLRCGRCGGKLTVSHRASGAIYRCVAGQANGSHICLSFGAAHADRHVGAELCRALSPLGVEAASAAFDQSRVQQDQALEHARLALQSAQYEADRAFEQFDLVDPKNRLVADSLEQRLNARLADAHAARERLASAAAMCAPLTEAQQQRLRELGQRFPDVWNHPDAAPSLKKRLLRAAIREIVVRPEPERQRMALVVHWQGGVHTELFVPKPSFARGRKAPDSLVAFVRELALNLEDAQIARVLNMKKTTTPTGLRWTLDRVLEFRRHHHIPAAPPAGDREFLSAQQAASLLGISRHGLLGLVRAGAITRLQATAYAPWRIARAELQSVRVQELVRALTTEGKPPSAAGDPRQRGLFGTAPPQHG